MRKNILPFIAIAIMIFFIACSTDELMPEITPETNPEVTPESGRTLSLTAFMPKEDDPSTRVALKQDGKDINLTWEAGDELQLAFVQEKGEWFDDDYQKIRIKQTVPVTNISVDGKKAQFNITLPDEITDGVFDLYGVYGGGGIEIDADDGTYSFNSNPYAILPSNPGSATSLNGDDDYSIEKRKDVMLYFTSTNIEVAAPNVSVTFQHLGSLFCITLKNTSSVSLQNIGEIRLVGVDGSSTWAYNSGAGGNTFDLVDEYLENYQESGGNQLSFKAKNNSLSAQGEATFWGWYPPLPSSFYNDYNKQPGLKLELIGTNSALVATSINSKPPRPVAAVAGKSYYFYATWDGSNLGFTDNTFAPPAGPVTIDVGTMGGLEAALGNQKNTITAMKVTGQINKTDFDVMKKMMPALTYLDLSDVTCEGNKIPDNAIGDNEWNQENKTISTIILPNSITTIGNGAFNSSGIKGSLSLPASVTSIGSNAFSGCYGLTGTLNLPADLTTLGEKAFSNCSGLTGTLAIPSGITMFGEGAFYGCSGFTSLILPSGITTIGTLDDEFGLFQDCSGFTGALTIPAGVTTIGSSAFLDCGFTSIGLSTGLKTIGDMAFYECSHFTGALSLPTGLETIGNQAFEGCTGFTSLTLPAGLTTIGYKAFKGCKGFTGSLLLPTTLTTFAESSYHEGSAFEGCTGFTGDLTIPAGVINIGRHSFRNCTGFTGSLTILGKETTFGEEAFSGCSGFISLSLPNEMTTIGNGAFKGCSGFSGPLTLPTALTTIGYGAFEGCSGFTGTLTLPASLTRINQSYTSGAGGAFGGCTGFTGHLIIPEGLIEIGGYSFVDCTGFTGFTLPANITTITAGLFAGCTGLTGSLDLSGYNQLTTIEESAFSGCSGFTASLTLPPSLEDIGGYAFYEASFTGPLNLPSAITTIGYEAFGGCTGFTSLTFSDASTLTTIDGYAFQNCSGITGTVTFPISLNSIGYSGFDGCSNVDAFQFPRTTPFDYSSNMLHVGKTVKVPTNAVATYQGETGWKNHPIVGY